MVDYALAGKYEGFKDELRELYDNPRAFERLCETREAVMQRFDALGHGPGADAVSPRTLGSEAERPAEGKKPEKPRRPVDWLGKAMILVTDHPEWSDAQIARECSIDPSRLSRNRQYQKGAALARGRKSDISSGSKDADGRVEAEDWRPHEVDEKAEGEAQF
jgi:hypothetical protein